MTNAYEKIDDVDKDTYRMLLSIIKCWQGKDPTIFWRVKMVLEDAIADRPQRLC